jgi:hypothetical protein
MAIDVKFKELRVAVVALNESKLLKEAIKLVGISKEEIYKQFCKAMDSIPDVDGKFPGPKEALDFSNKMIELEEAEKKNAVKGKVAAAAPVAKGKKGAAPAAKGKAPAKEKKEKSGKPSSMQFVRETVTANPEITIEKLIAAVKKAGYESKEVSIKMEWKKTLKNLPAKKKAKK